jgi:hypothetical protein
VRFCHPEPEDRREAILSALPFQANRFAAILRLCLRMTDKGMNCEMNRRLKPVPRSQ